MTVASASRITSYTATGGTDFAIPWAFMALADIKVYTFDPTTETQVQITSGLTITGTAEADGQGFSAGNVAFDNAPANGLTVTVVNEPPAANTTDLADGSALPAESLEASVDIVTMVAQRVLDIIARTPALRETSQTGTIELGEPVLGELLNWESVSPPKIGSTPAAVAGAASGKVKITANDTTAVELLAKLVAGANITLTLQNAGGNENILVDASVPAGSTASPQESIEAGELAALFNTYRNDATPTNADIIGEVRLEANDSGANRTVYVRLRAIQEDIADGSEDAEFQIRLLRAGVETLIASFTDGLVLGAATGGDQGAGSINAVKVFENGIELNPPPSVPQHLTFSVVGGARTALATARRFPAYGVLDDGVNGPRFYVAGGLTNTLSPVTTVEAYDPDPNTWDATPSVVGYTPSGRAASAVFGDRLYSFGGVTDAGGTVTNATQRYDASADDWTALTAMLKNSHLAAAVLSSIDSLIYIAGGQSSQAAGIGNDLWSFDPANEGAGYAVLTSMPDNLTGGSLLDGANGFLYYIGGWTNNARTVANGLIFVYDISHDAWSTVPTLQYPQEGWSHVGQASVNGRTYLVGGVSEAGGNGLTDIWEFDPVVLGFRRVGGLATGGFGIACGIIAGNLYTAGGDLNYATPNVTTGTGVIGALADQVAPVPGMRTTASPSGMVLVNRTTGVIGTMIGVRLGDVWGTLPFAFTTQNADIVNIGQSNAQSGLVQESPSGVFNIQLDGTTAIQWDSNTGFVRSNGDIINALAT